MRITQNQWTVRLSLIGLGLFALLASSRVVLTAQTPVVYVAPMEGMIDLGLAPFVQRVLSEATQEGAARSILSAVVSTRLCLSVTLC